MLPLHAAGELEELRTLQQFHKRALARKATPESSSAFTKKVMAAVQRQDAETHPADAAGEVLPSWRWHAAWGAFAGGRRWIAAPIAAAAVAVVVVLNPFSSPEQNLRPVSELKTTAAEVAAEPDDIIEHYLTEHATSVAEARLAGWVDSLQFVSYSK